jgi:hypothetical protein
MHKYSFNKAIKMLKSSIFFALIGSFFLLGCKKEISEVIKNDSESTYFNVQPDNAISISEVQNWFTSQFGKFKEVSSNPPVANFSSTDAYYFNESFRIEPIWSLAKQSTYKRRNPITIVPVQPIAFLDAKNQQYALIFYRDSLNRLQSKLQVYAAIESYKRENAKEKVKNFSGIMYQVDYSGLVHHVFAAKNGRLIQKFSLGPNRNGGQIGATPRGCFGLGPSIFEELWCVLSHVFDGGGWGWDPSVDVNIPFIVPTPIDYNLDFGLLYNNTGSGSGGSTNNNIDT